MDTYDEVKGENERLEAVLDAGARAQILAIPGVLGVGIGVKERGGALMPELSFRVYVREKLPESELPAGAVVPREVAGVSTDVVVVPVLRPLMADETRYRPVRGGIQITGGVPSGSSSTDGFGTLGCIGRNRRDGSIVALTNWHVLFSGGGDRGSRVHQPDIALTEAREATDANVIGIVGDGTVTERVDCAVVKLDTSWCRSSGIDWRDEVNGLELNRYSGIRGVTRAVADPGAAEATSDPRAFMAAHPDRVVYTVGAATGRRTTGIVTEVDTMAMVEYREVSDRRVTPTGRHTQVFRGQITIFPLDGPAFVVQGDSGAVVVNSRSEAIGLIYAENGGRGRANPIENVIEALHGLDPPVDFDINYTQPPAGSGTTRGAGISVPRAVAAPDGPNLWETARERLERSTDGAALTRAIQEHRRELVELVNGCRAVTVAWRRAQGPALMAHLLKSIAEPEHEIPDGADGPSLVAMAAALREPLMRHGSPALRDALDAQGERLLAAALGCRSFHEFAVRLEGSPP